MWTSHAGTTPLPFTSMWAYLSRWLVSWSDGTCMGVSASMLLFLSAPWFCGYGGSRGLECGYTKRGTPVSEDLNGLSEAESSVVFTTLGKPQLSLLVR